MFCCKHFNKSMINLLRETFSRSESYIFLVVLPGIWNYQVLWNNFVWDTRRFICWFNKTGYFLTRHCDRIFSLWILFSGYWRVCQRENRNALPPSPDQFTVRHGLQPRLHCVPWTGDDSQGKELVQSQTVIKSYQTVNHNLIRDSVCKQS